MVVRLKGFCHGLLASIFPFEYFFILIQEREEVSIIGTFLIRTSRLRFDQKF